MSFFFHFFLYCTVQNISIPRLIQIFLILFYLCSRYAVFCIRGINAVALSQNVVQPVDAVSKIKDNAVINTFLLYRLQERNPLFSFDSAKINFIFHMKNVIKSLRLISHNTDPDPLAGSILSDIIEKIAHIIPTSVRKIIISSRTPSKLR